MFDLVLDDHHLNKVQVAPQVLAQDSRHVRPSQCESVYTTIRYFSDLMSVIIFMLALSFLSVSLISSI